MSFLTSTVGKKFLMGLTGLVWAGFVLAHMLGNLLIFVSAEAYNLYGHMLTSGYVIYVAEAVLITALVIHVSLAVILTKQSRAARETRYAVTASGEKAVSLASRTMAIQGTIILIFIISHLNTFKFGTIYWTEINGEQVRDLYALMVEVFKKPMYVVGYLICLGLLGLHLKHGMGSIFQSLGLLHPAYQGKIKFLSRAYAALVVIGFVSTPIYIYLFQS